jgi:hypothetical protein
VVAEYGVEPVQEYRSDVFDPGHAMTGVEGFLAEVHIHHGMWPCPVRRKR